VRNRKGTLTSVKLGRTPITASDVNNAAGAQTVNEGEEVHMSFESNSSDEEIDVMTEDVQVDDDGNDDDDGGVGHNNSNSATSKSKEFSMEQVGRVTRATQREAGSQEKLDARRTNDNPKSSEISLNQTGSVTRARKREAGSQEKLDTRRTNDTPKSSDISLNQTGSVTRARKREVDSQEKPETQGTNELETSHSSTSDKEHNQVRCDQYCTVLSLFLRIPQGFY